MKRPFLVGTLFFIGGIIAGRYSGDTHIALFFATMLAAVFALNAFYRWKPVFLFAIFAAAGFAAYGAGSRISPEIAPYTERLVTVEGVVEEIAQINKGWKLIVRVAAIENAGRGSITGFDSGSVKIQVLIFHGEPVPVNSYVRFETVLESLQKAKNPGEFDEFLYLRARGVHFTAVIRDIPVSSSMEAPTLQRIRSGISAVYDSVLPEREAAVIKSMIIGDSGALDDRIKELYRVAGIYHILSISGLHIAVLAAALDVILKRILKPKTAAVCVIVFLAAYSVLTGASAAVVRAAVMYAVFLLGRLLRRDGDTLTSLAVAAAALLAYQPLYLWDIGFQYTFAAVVGLTLLSEPFANALKWVKAPKFLIDTFAVSAAATAATIPIAAHYFYNVAFYSIPVNIIIVPTATVVLVLGFVIGLVGLIFQPAALFLSGSVFALLTLYEGICEFFASLPGANLLTGSWPWPLTALWYGMWAVFAFCFWQKEMPGRRLWLSSITSVFVLAALGYAFMPKSTALYQLDTGSLHNGTARIVFSGHDVFIIDNGSNENGYAIKNFLEYKGIKNVTAYFATGKTGRQAEESVHMLPGRGPGIIFTDDKSLGLEYSGGKYNIPVERISAGQAIRYGDAEFYIMGKERLDVEISSGGKILTAKNRR